MRLHQLILRNLVYYWRTNLPIIGGVATAVAVLSGALLVGQSVRESLRRLLFERIGATDYLVTANRFFSEDLAGAFFTVSNSCPIIHLKGVVTLERTGIRAHDVNVYGVDERFWKFQGMADQTFPEDRAALVGAALAKHLSVRAGEAILLRVETQEAIPREWLYGHRDDVGKTIRLNCRGILPTNQLGEFSLRPRQGYVYSIFVPLKRLQKDLGQPSRANAILLSRPAQNGGSSFISNSLAKRISLRDLGLKLRTSPSLDGFSLESDRIILDDSIAQAALQAASRIGMKVSPIYSYLANSLRAKDRQIPYSVISAVDLGQGAMTSVQEVKPAPKQSPAPDPKESIWITDWAWRNLGMPEGEPLEVDYYIWQEAGKLETRTARFRLAGVLSTTGDVNTTLAPEIPGITQARSIRTWDPPFPLDLSRIRREDEDYWIRYRATPKAFITLAKGQELWANRFGKLTGLRIGLPSGLDLKSGETQFTEALLRNVDLRQAGFATSAVREQGSAASQGSTDFGEYFLYFSSFLIAAAILLSALFFRLMTEQRVREIGILRAAGFSASMLRRLFIFEGLLLSAAGSLMGLLGSIAYGWLMVFGLRTWWVGAVGTQRLHLHISWMDFAIGVIAGMFFSLLTIAWTLRGLGRSSPRMLLTGVLESIALRSRRLRISRIVLALALFAAALLMISSILGKVSQIEGFFGTGFLLLVSALCATALYLRGKHSSLISGNGWPAFFRFGLRNAMHRPGRSLLCASLIASATFIIVSMEAFRQDPRHISLQKNSGTGGYALVVETALPILHDPNSAAGLEESGLSASEVPGLEKTRFLPFRERPGDDTSCLNLYAPQEPRILGAPRSFVAAERFSFQSSLAATPEQKRNPWLLLESSAHNAAIPAIADANTIQYILHLSVGSEITVRGSTGIPIRLRLVAALRDSIFQGELLISEGNFLRLFPEHEGYRFFLIDAPPAIAPALIQPLQQSMADWGARIESSQERLKAYHQVENTYLSTFQSLGVLGLILGTIGLAAILLRNVLERRQELALLRAVGYRRRILSGIILSENIVLISWGLISGTICALLAILPALYTRGVPFPFLMVSLILMSVLIAGILSSILALIAAFRSPLLPALRSE